MEERLKKIEGTLSEHEKRLHALEHSPTENPRKPTGEAVRFDETGRPFFNVILPNASRVEIQRVGILLLMRARRDDEPEMSTKKISSLLHHAGVDVRWIKDAFSSLREERPALITSRPGKRTIILTGAGEEKANSLIKELPRK